MPHQVVIQYVPDIARDERINIGVIVLEDGTATTQLTTRWDRVRAFAECDIEFLKDLQEESAQWTEDLVRDCAAESTGSIVFTPPRGTLRRGADAMIDAVKRYL